MKIYIKNMVCIRCQMVVKNELEKIGLDYYDVKIGEANVKGDISEDKLKKLDNSLKKAGLELMTSRKNILVEQTATVIIDLVHNSDEQLKVNLSDFLQGKLNYNYTYLANLFSEVKHVSIEKFYLKHRIERVKELIVYDDLNISEIALLMHYSSVAHLSNQFKKLTGLTPSDFRKLKNRTRDTLENV